MTVISNEVTDEDSWWEELGSYKGSDQTTDKKQEREPERYSISTKAGTEDKDSFQEEMLGLYAEVSSLKDMMKTLALSLKLNRESTADKSKGKGVKPIKSMQKSMSKLIDEVRKTNSTIKGKSGNKCSARKNGRSSSSSSNSEDSSESDCSTSSSDSDRKINKQADSSSDSDPSEKRKPTTKNKSTKPKDKDKKHKEKTGIASSSTDPERRVFHVNVMPVIDTGDRGRGRTCRSGAARELSSSLSTDARQSDRSIEQLSFHEMDAMTKVCMKHLRHVAKGEWVSFLFLCRLRPFMSRYSLGQVRAAFESSVNKNGRPRFQVSPDGRSVRMHPETEDRR